VPANERNGDLNGWYLSAPWEPVTVRRGDSLGFRAAADHFADLLAPDLSNATSDARWISILSWCLAWSHAAWRRAGGGDLSRRDVRSARYAWLRPLELLWVDRTLASGQATGQLRGRRSIERWREADRRLPNFAMSADQFRRYRQVGTYAAYRVVLRAVSGLTTGDGWTPAATGLQLAKLVNDSLPREARLQHAHLEHGTKWGSWRDGNEVRFWLERGWRSSSAKAGGFLPTADDAVGKRLSEPERRLLAPALFGAGHVRSITAEALARATSALTHADLCDALAGSSALSQKVAPASLAPLAAFSRFADAALDAMRFLWNELNHDSITQSPAVATLARSAELRSRLDVARGAGTRWLRDSGRRGFVHAEVVTRLAEALRDARAPIDQLRALSQHHHVHGAGRRWFHEQAGKMVPLMVDSGIPASDYRFRLRSLCRLAAQCGVANLRVALEALGGAARAASTGSAPDDEDDEVP
jgi:hypothetical protein